MIPLLRRRLAPTPSTLRLLGVTFLVLAVHRAALVLTPASDGPPTPLTGEGGAARAVAVLPPAASRPATEPEAAPGPSWAEAPTGRPIEPAAGDTGQPEPAPLVEAAALRHARLERLEAELKDRERTLEVVERRINDQLTVLKAERQAFQTALDRQETIAEADVARLVAIYETMKPKDAARIFDAMPPEVAAGFVRRMDEAKSALILANVEAERAYAITLAIAGPGASLRTE